MDNVILFPTLWNVFYDCQAALTLSKFYTVAFFSWYYPKIMEDFLPLLSMKLVSIVLNFFTYPVFL